MKRFRFLQTGDVHVGRGRAIWGAANCLVRAEQTFDALFAAAAENKCDAVLICGDLFDTKNVTIKERELVTRKLFQYAGADGIPTYIIPGNHDLTTDTESNLDYLAAISDAEEAPNLYVANARQVYEWKAAEGLAIIGAPIGFSEHQAEVESITDGLDKDRQFIFMGHGTIQGCMRNDANWRPSEAEDAKRLSLRQAAANAPQVIWWAYGDIHKRQPLPTLPKGANGWYAGSPIQQDFGETEDRGCLVIALDQTPNGWIYRGRRYVRLDGPDSAFDPLVTILHESQIASLPPKAFIRLGRGLVLSEKRHEQVVKEYKVVEDRSTPAALRDVGSTAQQDELSPLEVFDPLLADLSVVEREVLADLVANDGLVESESKKVVGLAVERFRSRTYLT